MTSHSILRLGICLFLTFSVAVIGGLVTYPQIATWYAALDKPSWTPPNWLFPIVWNILYAMMGYALWLLWERADSPRRRTAILLFLMQLALNALWTPVFFGAHQTGAAILVIVALAIVLCATIVVALGVHCLAAILLLPYLAWVIYAGTLNTGIWWLNS